MSKFQIPASFWRRTFTTLGDLSIFLFLAYLISSLYLVLSKIFASFVGRYILFEGTVVLIAMIVAILYLFVPKFLGGKTLFSYITRVKIVSTRNAKIKFSELVSRQKLLAIFWIVTFCIFGFFMNPNLLHKITDKPFTKQHVKLLTNLEQFLFLVPATFSLFSFFANVICFFSTTQKSTPFFELYSGTQLVFEKIAVDEKERTSSRS